MKYRMGLYGKYVFPRLLEWALGNRQAEKLRRQSLAPVRGDVLEIGFGTGLNLPFYAAGLTRLTTVEPENMLSEMVAQRIARSGLGVRQLRLDASGRLPLDDQSFDFVVSTWTLCSISNVTAALRETQRVLRPGGRFVFLEHGRSDFPNVARWQDRLNPIQKVIGCGCHMNRAMDKIITASGYEIESLNRFVMKDTPRLFGEMYQGMARSSGKKR
ncbi:MAG: class I SAM-dependent methyltransferase [Blastocatellia bacterium]